MLSTVLANDQRQERRHLAKILSPYFFLIFDDDDDDDDDDDTGDDDC